MNEIYFSGFADEAGVDLETQIRATRELGWSNIEMRSVRVPGFEKANLHDIPDEAFEIVVRRLEEAAVRVNSLGSAIANGGKDIRKPFVECLQATRRAAPRAVRLGAEFVRVMSYPVGEPPGALEDERFRRLREITAIFADHGVQTVHENCANYGGMGWRHSLRLIENVPGLKLVFDTGNPVADRDYSVQPARDRQSSLEFFRHVRQHVVYIHIKDAVARPEGGAPIHVFPGGGQGQVREVLRELAAMGYSGGLSIEPHMGAGLPDISLSTEENSYRTYLEYGRRTMALVREF